MHRIGIARDCTSLLGRVLTFMLELLKLIAYANK